MGFSSFWSSLTGPRVKEIQPQEKCRWLEHPRPYTASGSRSVKSLKFISKPVHADRGSEDRSSNDTEDDNRSRRKRRLTLLRTKSDAASKRSRSVPGRRPERDDSVPDVPCLPPTPVVSRYQHFNNRGSRNTAFDDDLTRPGTAVTTDESIQSVSTEIFELAADSPLQQSPKEDKFDMSLEDETEGETKNETNNWRGSNASEKPKLKRASWFRKTQLSDKALPAPPIHSPEMEQPPVPDDEVEPSSPQSPSIPRSPSLPSLPVSPTTPLSATLPDQHHHPVINELPTVIAEEGGTTADRRTSTYSLGADSLLDSFPAVPSPGTEKPPQIAAFPAPPNLTQPRRTPKPPLTLVESKEAAPIGEVEEEEEEQQRPAAAQKLFSNDEALSKLEFGPLQ